VAQIVVKAFWNLIDILSSLTVIAFCLCDIFITDGVHDRGDILIIGSVANNLMWFKMFYLMRIFGPTSSFIRMIIEIIKDMKTFLAILMASVFVFANSFFVIDGAFRDEDQVRASGDDYLGAFTSTYMMGLGEWDTEKYPESPHTAILWITFILCTFLV
jgi:hypothetical protein